MKNLLHVTLCKNCIFAEWDGNEQIQCKQNRLRKYLDQGRAKPIQDHDVKTYAIQTICNTCRDEVSATVKGYVNPVTEVRQEVRIKVAMLLPFLDNDNFNSLYKVLKQISKEHVPPNHVIIAVCRKKKVNYQSLFDKCQAIFISHNIKFSIVQIVNVNNDVYYVIDESVKQVKSSQFYVIIDHNQTYPRGLVKQMDRYINDEVLSLPFILSASNSYVPHLLTCQVSLHHALGGNKNGLLTFKVKEYSKLDNKQHLIKTWDEICSYLKSL